MFEPQLPGFSGASHKVEFVFYQPSTVLEFDIGQTHIIDELEIELLAIANPRARFKITKRGESIRLNFFVHRLLQDRHCKGVLGSDTLGLKLSALQAESARLCILDLADVRASVESKRVGAQRFADSESLGAGIQTIEKAKQASLVAVDADIKFNGSLRVLSVPGYPRRYISLVILGNGVHWTEKDKRILETFVDYTFLVPDETIIRYADYIRLLAAEHEEPFLNFFMSHFRGMTKTPPDSFAVSADDFTIICPETETRSLTEILEQQIDHYLAV